MREWPLMREPAFMCFDNVVRRNEATNPPSGPPAI
jgi:hypothetical protein